MLNNREMINDPNCCCKFPLLDGFRCSANIGQYLSFTCPLACLNHTSKLRDFFISAVLMTSPAWSLSMRCFCRIHMPDFQKNEPGSQGWDLRIFRNSLSSLRFAGYRTAEILSFQENLTYVNLGQMQGTFFVLPGDPWSPVMVTFITQPSFPQKSIFWTCSDLNESSMNYQIFHILYGASEFLKWHYQLGWWQTS